MNIDLHTHILPRTWPDLAAQRAGGEQPYREVPDICWNIKRRLEEMDKDDVGLHVLSTVPSTFHYGAKSEEVLNLTRILNSHLAASVGMNPKRFAALGTLPLQDPAMAVGELKRCMTLLGLRGVEIGTSVNGRELGAPELFPVFAAAAELGAAILVHGSKDDSGPAVNSVAAAGIFTRLPGLRIAFSHGGGNFAKEHAGKFYADTLGLNAEEVKALVDLIGVEKVAFGSGFLFPEGEVHSGKLLAALPDLGAEANERLLSGTAFELLALTPDVYV
ncbi:MAG: amidohydrolase family protein [Elusimicrobiota bacterium]